MANKEAAKVALTHITDNINSLRPLLNWDLALDKIRISFTDLASVVNKKLPGAKYDKQRITMPLGLIKLAINKANKEDDSVHIPQITFVVVNAADKRTPCGAMYDDRTVLDSEQPLALRAIYEFSWTGLIRNQLINLINNGPSRCTSEMFDASIPHWWP